jgi:hypothetical protein
MSRIDALLRAYASQLNMPWAPGLSGGEKVWFCIYDKGDERRLRLHLPEFGNATRAGGHGWHEVDLTNAFAEWMASQEYRESYFENPELLDTDKLRDFFDSVVARIRDELGAAGVDSVLAVTGVGALFGFLRVSEVAHSLERQIGGRLLVFFPGDHENGNYRFLDARDGWSYHAIPILPDQGATSE